MTRTLGPGIVAASLLLSTLAWGQGGEPSEEDRQAAQREFAEGQRAFNAKDYRRAAEQFEAAYRHKPHPSPLWNAARAWQRAGEPVRAANLYSKFLREAPPDSRDRNTAHIALAELTPKLGRLELHVAGLTDIAVDGAVTGESTVYVSPGSHLVEAKHQGKPVRQTASVEAGQSVSVTLVAPSAPPPQPPPPPPKPPPDVPPEAKPATGWSPTVFWVGLGLTAVATGVAVWSGVDTLQEKRNYDANPSQESLDSGKGKQLRTNIFLGVAGGLALFTAVTGLFLVSWKGAEDPPNRGSPVHHPPLDLGMSFAHDLGPWFLTARGTFR
jgi:hypothetical protein